MFDLTTIQLINNHPVAFEECGMRTRDLIRAKNIQESWNALCVGAEALHTDPITLLDTESCFAPPPFMDWPKECYHCGKPFDVASHDPTDTWTCSQECRDAWVPF